MRNTTVLIVSAFAGFGAFWWTLAKEPPSPKRVPIVTSDGPQNVFGATTGGQRWLRLEEATDRLRADPLDIIAWGSLGYRLAQNASPTDAIDTWIAPANAPLRNVGQIEHIARYWTGHGLLRVDNEPEGVAMIRDAADFFADLTSQTPKAATYLDWRTAAFSEYHATRESPDLESVRRKLGHAIRMLVPRLSANPQNGVLTEHRRRLAWLGGEIGMAVDFNDLMPEDAENGQP